MQLMMNRLIKPSLVVLVGIHIDYRMLKAVTVNDCYPLLRIDRTHIEQDCFSTLNLESSYWQMVIVEDAKQKQKWAFICGEGLYQFWVMPVGLVNAPATFKRMMKLMFVELHWQICLVYHHYLQQGRLQALKKSRGPA